MPPDIDQQQYLLDFYIFLWEILFLVAVSAQKKNTPVFTLLKNFHATFNIRKSFARISSMTLKLIIHSPDIT